MRARAHITATHNRLTRSWAPNVEALEQAVEWLNEGHQVTNDCRVAFFEIPLDEQLHVNVTHKYRTRTVRGWAGPAIVPDGFVHNRRFGAAPPNKIAGQIRKMVFAARVYNQPAISGAHTHGPR